MKINIERRQESTTKARYVKPEIVEHGSLTKRTLNSETGADPESFIDNVVCGN